MRLQNVVIPTRDFSKCVAFYRDALALPVLTEGATYCFLRMGSVQLAIHPAEESGPFAPTGNGIYLDMLVEDIALLKERLHSAGIAILREWMDNKTPFLLIADPDGHRLEIYSAPLE